MWSYPSVDTRRGLRRIRELTDLARETSRVEWHLLSLTTLGLGGVSRT